MTDGPDDPLGHLRFGLPEVAVNTGNDVVKASQQLVVVVEPAVGQDVAFDALEEPNPFEPPVEGVYFGLLPADAVRAQTVPDAQGLRVVAEADILQPHLPCRLRHLFQRIAAIT